MMKPTEILKEEFVTAYDLVMSKVGSVDGTLPPGVTKADIASIAVSLVAANGQKHAIQDAGVRISSALSLLLAKAVR